MTGHSNSKYSRYYRAIGLVTLMVFALAFRGQDTTVVKSKTRMGFAEKWNMKPHSPLRATVYSAVIPGTGQVYNRKAWKGLVAVGGLGTCGAFIVYNNQKYQLYRNALVAELDEDPSTVNDTGYSIGALDQLQETYHQWRDLSYICLGAVYLLQVLDANVDGHLFYYDVSDDLSFNFHPSVVNTSGVHPALGLTIRF